MAKETFAHNPSTTVSSGGTTAPASGTSEAWTVAASTSFPAAATGVTQFHVADPAFPNELILVTNVSGTAWTVTRGADSTVTSAHTSGFTVYQVTPASFLGALPYQPWQFLPESYGAFGNGRVIGDGVINGTTTFTSASAGFTSADTGKTIMINGGQGTTSAPLITTITFVNATTVTLASAATASASGCSAIYGTDDTTAINNCVTAASTYAQANNFKAQIIFGAKFYCLTSGPTQSGNGSSTVTYNSQIPLPIPNANGSTQKLVLEFIGTGDNSNTQYWESTIPNLQGTCLVSMVLAPGSGGSATFGAQSVIGGPTGSFGLTGNFANMKPVMRGITVVCGWGAQQIGYDFRRVGGASVDQCSYQAFAAVLGNAPLLSTIPTAAGTNGVGLYMPAPTNNDDAFCGSFSAECVGVGVAFAEHFVATKLACIYCFIGAFVNSPGGVVDHGANIVRYSCEASGTSLTCASVTNSGFPINIGLLDTEVISTADIADPNNVLFGVIHWADFERTTMTVTGAANLKIINDRLGPGHMASPPAVPGSTSSAALIFRDAWVSVHTGAGVTVSAVTIDGTATGLTMVASSSLGVPVPSGKTIALTYAGGTPTWDWWLS